MHETDDKGTMAPTTNVAQVLKNFDRIHDDRDDNETNDQTATATTTTMQDDSGSNSIYQFTPKFQSSTKNNPLCGITSSAWWQMVRSRAGQIEWFTYAPRLLVISILSFINALLAWLEHCMYEQQIQATPLHPRPVFVLGHPRTGTTLLHSLLALDVDCDHDDQDDNHTTNTNRVNDSATTTTNFAICSTFCAGFPSCFLWFERWGKQLFRGVIDETRPMDNVPLDFDLPQEDELATNLLSAGTSPYMPLYFMKQEATDFRPFYAFDDDTKPTGKDADQYLPPDQMATARQKWTNAFLYLLRKLTLRAQLQDQAKSSSFSLPPPRRLLLKSPVHTARIRLLTQLFPEAQFIYIHRHPYEVFQSAAHMADTTYWYTYLNTPTNQQIQEFILRQYEILWDRYQEGKSQLQLQQQLVEVSYDELAQDPMATLDRIYQSLGWALSDKYRSKLQRELGLKAKTTPTATAPAKRTAATTTPSVPSPATYKRNRHKPLPAQLRRVIDHRWGSSFETLGYAKAP